MCKVESFYRNASFGRECKIQFNAEDSFLANLCRMKSYTKCRSKFESQFLGFRINVCDVICCNSAIL